MNKQQPTLETLIEAWQNATPEQKEAAISILHGNTKKSLNTPAVIRWKDLAERLQVTKRTARTATQKAGITPVILPGRKRAIGIRTRDLYKLNMGAAI